WRLEGLNSTELWICQKLTGETLTQFGYGLETASVSLLRLAYFVLTWLPKTGLAFILNLGRTRSPINALKRRFGWAY
ncbi:MAG: hypothetical protein ACE5M4_10745, partial [Anaerolineales bacterium]